MDFTNAGKWILLAGLGLAGVGGLVWLLGRTGIPSGNLPGDVSLTRRNLSIHFPIVTCIVLSLVLTLVLNLVLRWLRR